MSNQGTSSGITPILKLADMCVNNFENQINKSKPKCSLQLWQWYVDDISLIWSGSDRQLEKFFVEQIALKKTYYNSQ